MTTTTNIDIIVDAIDWDAAASGRPSDPTDPPTAAELLMRKSIRPTRDGFLHLRICGGRRCPDGQAGEGSPGSAGHEQGLDEWTQGHVAS